MAVQIQLRNDTAANWTSADPILATGEIGLETDTGQLKLGDGATSWTSLGYFEPSSLETLSDVTITDVASGDAITWNGSAWVNTNLTTALAGKVDGSYSANVRGLSYTLQSSDANKVVLMNNPSPVNVTVPSSVFAKGNRVDIIANTTAAVTFVAGSGLSLLSKDGLVALDGQYKAASIYFYDSATAYLIGDLA